MKAKYFLLTPFLLASSLWAEPFERTHVAEDTKWLVHVDVDGLRQSSIGSFALVTAKAEMAKNKDNQSMSVDVDALIQEIHSITAYGATFDDHPENHSVAIIRAGQKAQTMIDGFIASQELGDKSVNVTSVAGKKFPTYLIGGEVYMSFPRKDTIIVSKDFTQIERALTVIEGRAATLAKNSPLLTAVEPNAFFFLASAQGLDTLKSVPPQARILQKANGANLAIGEKGGNLTTQLVLATSGPEVSNQLRRIVDGMLALVSFAQMQGESLNKLAESITVTESPTAVLVNLKYPVEDVKRLSTAAMVNNGSSVGNAAPAPTPAVVSDAIGGERLKVANVDARADNGHLARNATDNDPNSYWSADGRPNWLRLELERYSVVREVQISWHDLDKTSPHFMIQSSTNVVKWDKIFEATADNKATGLQSYNIPDTRTQWIRIFCTNSPHGISDVRLFGESGVEVQVENDAASSGK